ncbi:MAG: hypothetical protein EHM70_17215, partial [Chloroflexota bacterium]
MDRLRRFLSNRQRIFDFLWALAMLGLPLTSFTLFVRLTRAVVAPFTALPVFLLLMAWLVPYLLRGGALPRESKPLFLFGLVALAASAGALFIDIPTLKGRSVLGQEARAFVTLVIGAAFYLIFAAYPREEEQLNKTLRWIHIGGLVMMTWTIIQFFYLNNPYGFPVWADRIQEVLVTKTPNRGARITGLAYEPSWFGHQMIMLYIPLWLAASYERTSAFKVRILRYLTIENFLLVFGLVEFFYSLPRLSMAALLLVCVYLFYKGNLALYRKAAGAIASRKKIKRLYESRLIKSFMGLAATGILLAFYASLGWGILYLGSQRD